MANKYEEQVALEENAQAIAEGVGRSILALAFGVVVSSAVKAFLGQKSDTSDQKETEKLNSKNT